MNKLEVEKRILGNIILNECQITYDSIKDERKKYIEVLYSYISEIIIPYLNDNDLFEDTIKEVVSNFLAYEDEFDLSNEMVYKLHINIINRIFNTYLFNKFNITKEFGVKIDDTILPLTTNSIVNFDINYCNSYFNSTSYKLSLNFNKDVLIPKHIQKIKDMDYMEIMSISEIDFPEIKRQFESFYIKYNALIENIKNEIDDLNKFCNFNFII